jgi:hypothetical protein
VQETVKGAGRVRAVPSEPASGEAARSEAKPSEGEFRDHVQETVKGAGRVRAVPSEPASGEAARSEAKPSEVD